MKRMRSKKKIIMFHLALFSLVCSVVFAVQTAPLAIAATYSASASSIDVDKDGYPDCYEQDKYKNDHDNDGVKDADDTDDDADGIIDSSDDKKFDHDNDGTKDQDENAKALNSDNDSDGDGYLDKVEQSKYQKNHDNDGKKDSDDGDDDADGLKDKNEKDANKRNHDNDKKDGDPYKDRKDPDNDNDGIKDWAEKSCAKIYDHDNDGLTDIKDQDDDNDGFNETDEDGNPVDDDAYPNDHDNDGTKDVKDKDDDNDGTSDSKDNFPFDADNDGTDDVDDTDSTVATRMYYGYAIYDAVHYYGDTANYTADHGVFEGVFHYVDGEFFITSLSGTGIKKEVEDGVTLYNVTDSDAMTLSEEEAYENGLVTEAGYYSVSLAMPNFELTGFDQDGLIVGIVSSADGYGGQEGCEEPDLNNNVLGEFDCNDGFVSLSETLSGTYLDQTSGFDPSQSGSQLNVQWKFVPTVCGAFESCPKPDEATVPDGSYDYSV